MNEEEIGSDECQRSLHQIRTDQVQVFSPITKESDQSSTTALNANENSDVERNQQTGPEEPINVCVDDIKDLIKESTAGLPAKKKRRMGMCGLTKKERSHFLLTQKHENGQNREDKVEKPVCDNTAEPVALGKNTPPSIPAEGQNVALSEEVLKLQSSHCEEDEKAERKAHVPVGPSDGSTAVCDPDCSVGKGFECEDGFVTGSEPAGNSDQLAEKEVGGNLDSQTLQELKARISEVTDEIPEKPEEGGSAKGKCSSAVSFCTSRDDKSDNWDAVEAPLLQVKSVTGTRDEKKEEMSGDVVGGDGADEGASCSRTQPGGLKCGSVELREAAATPSVSERKDSRDSDEPAAGPSTAHAEHAQTLDTADSFGRGCLDYVSDSQLNTIVLIEDEMMWKDEGPDSSDRHEDATDLICGLTRELASLNRKVMATYRELQSLRRSSKTSRSATR
ncbi:uncharacterized protein LOC115788989 [Archocentrus centrarchus]|uniref:uncharacterized protein LOC115788989 n=1 Tax=Archocentrus centrarchus TaxID=63155 RepID=UPI0011E9C9BB|nr:uncharacterized protein LOC115788989 [Archocentrus centrarchus]